MAPVEGEERRTTVTRAQQRRAEGQRLRKRPRIRPSRGQDDADLMGRAAGKANSSRNSTGTEPIGPRLQEGPVTPAAPDPSPEKGKSSMPLTSRSSRTRTPATPEAAVEPAAARRPPTTDLWLELYRRQTLLLIMAARLRESAGNLAQKGSPEVARVRRAVDIHRRFLREVQLVDEERVAKALAGISDARAPLERCAQEHPKAERFERTVEPLLAHPISPGSPGARRLADLFRAEADRIEEHVAWEEEKVHAHLERWLTPPVRDSLLEQIRRFEAPRVDAEIALIAWASRLHPSSD